MKTLAEYIADQEKAGTMDTEKAFSLLLEFAKNKDNESLKELIGHFKTLVDGQKSILEAHGKTQELLKGILERPHPAFPEPKDFPVEIKTNMDKPSWWKDTDNEGLSDSIVKGLAPLLMEIVRRGREEGESTRQILEDILDKEPVVLPQNEKTKLPMNIGSIRRHSRWQIATFPNLPGTSAITSAGDGVTFYLPSAVQKNSETIRLNGGLPLSQGIDYTLTGNQIIFVQNQSGSNIEIRFQT